MTVVMKLKILPLCCAVVLSGCVTSSPDTLLSAAPASSPTGTARTNGQFPSIGNVPVGQTSQITPTEKAAVKTELARDAAAGQRQAAQDSQAAYLKEVARMRKLAADRKKQLQREIEGTSRVQ